MILSKMSLNNKSHVWKANYQARILPLIGNSRTVIEILQSKLSIICDLCNHQVIGPRICPSCNQIFCEGCLFTYFQSHQNCPMCHSKFHLGQFLDCECNDFLYYFKSQLKQLKISNQQQKCPEHQIPMKYFCEDCSKPICSDCGMMSVQHRSHKFSRLDDVYAMIREKLSIQLNRLTKKIFQAQENSVRVKKKVQKLQIQHMHIKRYTEEYYILLVQKFEQQIGTKTVCLKQIQQKNSKEIQFYESCRDSICEQIQKKSKNQLINEVDKLASSFTMVTCEPPEPVKVQECFQTIKQLLPDYANFQYTLRGFSLNSGGIVYSQGYLLNGVEWRLKIYPRGNGVAKGKYLSVFVEMSKAQTNQKKYEYKIQLISKEPTPQNIRRQYCSAFDIGQCWGYNQFILLQQLQIGFLNDDKLNLIMGIRNTDYRSLSQDQSTYINKLQSQIKLKQLQRQNHMQETNIIDGLQQRPYPSKNNNSQRNQAKLLRFMDSSAACEERVGQRRHKQKQRDYGKSQKDYEGFVVQFQQQQGQGQNLQRSNLQVFDQLLGEKPINNQALKAENYMKQQSEQTRIRQSMHTSQFDKDKKQHLTLNIGRNNQKIIIQGGVDQSTQNYLYQPKLKNQSKPEQKLSKKGLKQQKQARYQRQLKQGKLAVYQKQRKQPKEDKLPSKTKDKGSNLDNKYEFYFFNSKKNKNFNKQQQKLDSGELIDKQKDCNDLDYQSQSRHQDSIAGQVQTNQEVKNRKYQEYKVKKYVNTGAKFHEQKKGSFKSKQFIKKSPAKFKNWVQQEQNRDEHVSNILEQSKKLEGIQPPKSNILTYNSSGIRQTLSNSSILRSPTKNGHIRIEKQKEQKTHVQSAKN